MANMGTDTCVNIIIHSAAKSIISQSSQTSHTDPARSLFHTAVCVNIWALMDCHDSCLPWHTHTLAFLLLMHSIDLIAFAICVFVSSGYLHMLYPRVMSPQTSESSLTWLSSHGHICLEVLNIHFLTLFIKLNLYTLIFLQLKIAN